MKKRCNSLDLFLELYQNSQLPNCYLNVSYKDRKIFNSIKAPYETNFLVYSHRLSPSYLDFSINKKVFKFNKIKQTNKGYAIDLAGLSSSQAYMDLYMSRNSRKMVRQSIRRLENSFNISYKMYTHNLSKEEFDKFLDCLRDMLDKRFIQKKIKDEKLDEWKQMKEGFYNFFKEKKASIFVIYNSVEPIGISLNYLLDQVVFSSISSYNTDYSKFGLGHVDVYKHIEWCLENDYKVMELGYGDHDYKNKWCNNIYNFEHHILYNRNSVLGNIFGGIEYCKVYIKEYLKRKGFDVYLKRLKK